MYLYNDYDYTVLKLKTFRINKQVNRGNKHMRMFTIVIVILFPHSSVLV